MCKIFVNNLSPHSSESDVRNLFAQWEEILSIRLVTNRRSGKCRGYGVVEMKDIEANAAANALDGKNLEGKTSVVTPLIGC